MTGLILHIYARDVNISWEKNKKPPIFRGIEGGGIHEQNRLLGTTRTMKLSKAFFKVMAFDFFNQGGAFDVKKFGGIFLNPIGDFHRLRNQ